MSLDNKGTRDILVNADKIREELGSKVWNGYKINLSNLVDEFIRYNNEKRESQTILDDAFRQKKELARDKLVTQEQKRGRAKIIHEIISWMQDDIKYYEERMAEIMNEMG